MRIRICILGLALAAMSGIVPYAAGQAITISFTNTGVSDWNNPANWATVDVPPLNVVPGDGFPADVAQISNGGTAFLSAAAQFPIDGVVLADGGGSTGTLELRSGGSLTVVDADPGAAGRDGGVLVGGAGAGTLFANGGTLNAATLTAGGAAGSLIRAEGSSTINLTGNAALNRITRIVGPNVNFSVGGNVNVAGTFQPVITGSTHSAIQAPAGTATVGGNLAVEFSGVTPAFGNSWTLIDAADATGAFASITATGVTLPRGLVVDTAIDAGGNGNVSVGVENRLILKVDRGSGSVVLENAAGAPIAFDGYSIQSPGGWLLSSNARWSSLDDLNIGSFAEANPSPNGISELAPTGSTSLAVGATRSLGTPFEFVPTAFGQSGDDLIFTYSRPTGEIETGIIEYSGDVNNLVLQVDPDTGKGQIDHQSPLTATIDSYSITSASGSLIPAGWNSFDDQNIATWAEANPKPTALTELLPIGGFTITEGNTFNLGTIFNVDGDQDWRFRSP